MFLMKQPARLPDNVKRHFVTIEGFGHKNIDCPKYEDCLDEACEYDLPFWLCNGCPNEFVFADDLVKVHDFHADTWHVQWKNGF